jgi:hypothetical protein
VPGSFALNAEEDDGTAAAAAAEMQAEEGDPETTAAMADLRLLCFSVSVFQSERVFSEVFGDKGDDHIPPVLLTVPGLSHSATWLLFISPPSSSDWASRLGGKKKGNHDEQEEREMISAL